MVEAYEPCGGCGADHPSKRCINCFHDFGGERPDHQNKEGLELLPCPFCENPAVECQRNGPNEEQMKAAIAYEADWDVSYFVACWCGATGPERGDEEAAIAAWNRRTPDPSVSSLREENERLRKERDEALAEIDSMTRKFVAYEYLESPAGREIAETALSASQAQLKIYREALEPFADFGELLELETEGFSDTDRLELVPEESDVRIGDLFVSAFRRARTALSQEAGE